jgi:hypothetical protein
VPKHGFFHDAFDWQVQLKRQISQLDPKSRQEVVVEGCENQIHLSEFCITFGSKGYFQILKRNSGFDGHSAHLWGQR